MEIHPNFDPLTKAHDLCMLQFYPLADQTTDAGILGSACLPEDHDVDLKMCWTAGWGSASADSGSINTPREVPLNVFPHDYCVEKTDNEVLKYDQFCAGVPDNDENGQADGGQGLLNQ